MEDESKFGGEHGMSSAKSLADELTRLVDTEPPEAAPIAEVSIAAMQGQDGLVNHEPPEPLVAASDEPEASGDIVEPAARLVTPRSRSWISRLRREREMAPTELLERDQEAQRQAPELLRDVPYFKLEGMLASSEQTRNAAGTMLTYLDSGNESIVFRLQDETGKDSALKLFFNRMPPDVLKQVLRLAPLEKSLVATLRKKYANANSHENHGLASDGPLGNAGGHVLGHDIEPELVDLPDGLVTLGGEAVGIMTPTIVGEHLPSGLYGVPGMADRIKRLSRGRAQVDPVGNNEISYVDKNGVRRIKIIDIKASEHLLNDDPRVLHSGEIWVRELQPSEDAESLRLNGLLSYDLIRNRIKVIQDVFKGAEAGGRRYSYSDVLDGKAWKSSDEEREAFESQIEKFSDFTQMLIDEGVDPSARGVYFDLSGAGVRYLWDPGIAGGSDEQVAGVISRDLVADYSSHASGANSFTYLQKISGHEQLGIALNDGRVSMTVKDADGNTTLKVDQPVESIGDLLAAKDLDEEHAALAREFRELSIDEPFTSEHLLRSVIRQLA